MTRRKKKIHTSRAQKEGWLAARAITNPRGKGSKTNPSAQKNTSKEEKEERKRVQDVCGEAKRGSIYASASGSSTWQQVKQIPSYK